MKHPMLNADTHKEESVQGIISMLMILMLMKIVVV